MRIGRDQSVHLTYCTNIHKGETWAETFDAIRLNVPPIQKRVGGAAPFGIGLRLSAAAASGLCEGDALAEFKRYLATQNAYVFTINGFPYGDFHGVRVKENVYSPDWADPDRLAYTNRLADILCALLPQGMEGSISTVPGSFAPWAQGRIDAIRDRIVDHVAHLVEIEKNTGKRITLALEPEPCCMLETIEEAVAFFKDQIYSAHAVARLCERTALTPDQSAKALRDHVGLCYDVCHAAIEFEDPRQSIEKLRENFIPIYKLQLSSALRFGAVDHDTGDLLAPFNEPTYLHQVVGRRDGNLKKWLDLKPALDEIETEIGSEWRVHFHVPVFLETMGAFGTTQAFLRDILALHREHKISDHLEVETYTWDVLPEQYRGEPMPEAIARELNWVLDQLEQ